MSFLDLAKKRCSTRAYQPVPVSQEHIDAIAEAARVAPTAANRQPVRILQVTSEEGLASLAKAANVFDAPLAFVVCADGEKAWKRPLDGMSTCLLYTSSTRNVTKPMTNAMAAVPSATGTRLPRSASNRPP